MAYKNIILSALLLPLTVVGSNNAARIQKLEEKLSQKELEVSDLGKNIAEKNELLSSFGSKIQESFGLSLDRKRKQLQEKKADQSLSQEEEAQLYTELKNELEEFYKNFESAYQGKQNIAGMLMSGLFQKDDFEPIKFYMVQYACELEALKNLVKKYENHIQELAAIKTELEVLHK